MESLFSLEVIVNHATLRDVGGNKARLSAPTVAFRLLDYPTIAIHFPANHASADAYSKAKHQQRYTFAKGKSCLFHADVDTLRQQLRHMPLYIMLLDKPPSSSHQTQDAAAYKLVGMCSVSLRNVAERICSQHNAANNSSSDISSNESIELGETSRASSEVMHHYISNRL